MIAYPKYRLRRVGLLVAVDAPNENRAANRGAGLHVLSESHGFVIGMHFLSIHR